jgi:uncharacterized protein
MEEVIIADTGVLVALIDAGEAHHDWAIQQWRTMPVPVLTCEAVITEATFLLFRNHCDPGKLLAMIERGALRPAFDLAAEITSVRALMEQYASVPMSLADACLVRMSEAREHCRIFTLDGDFRIYRRHRRRTVPLLMPPH